MARVGFGVLIMGWLLLSVLSGVLSKCSSCRRRCREGNKESPCPGELICKEGKCYENSPCDPNPCRNNGKCELFRGQLLVCRCAEGYGGERCEETKG